MNRDEVVRIEDEKPILQQDHVEHENVHYDKLGSKMGMWIFLFTELVLFGGLFILYMGYRAQYSMDFHTAAKELDVTLGAVNTIILLTSSLTMAFAVEALRRGLKKFSLIMLISTIGFSLVFLVNKFFEWSAKFHHGIYPGGEDLLARPNGQNVFFGLYFTMTGLHGIHVIVGAILLTFIYVFIRRGSVNQDRYMKLENSGLYWHLVDLIWIFLFPLFYLIQ